MRGKDFVEKVCIILNRLMDEMSAMTSEDISTGEFNNITLLLCNTRNTLLEMPLAQELDGDSMRLQKYMRMCRFEFQNDIVIDGLEVLQPDEP